MARSFVRHGVGKLRLTGGEPLLRKGVEGLIAKLALIPEVEDLTLTTNGASLDRKARDLAASGSAGSRSASTRWTTPCSRP